MAGRFFDSTISPINSNGILILLVMQFLIYMNFILKAESLAYTRCSIFETFKKPGLAKEALGKLGNLTPVF